MEEFKYSWLSAYDFAKFSNDSIGGKNVLKKGEGFIIYFGQAHISCLSVDKNCYEKKQY